MNPMEALRTDWQMYYNGTFMLYEGKRQQILCGRRDPYQDEAPPAGTILGRASARHDYVALDPAKLTCWWPRSGAVQIGMNAVYIGRKGYRNMKKSAVMQQHYSIMWGDQRVRDRVLWLIDKAKYIPYKKALKDLKAGNLNAAAISCDLILYDDGTNINVVCRGEQAGTLEGGKFLPMFEGTPAAKRALVKLQREGIPCI